MRALAIMHFPIRSNYRSRGSLWYGRGERI
jgi:hypothetical protein